MQRLDTEARVHTETPSAALVRSIRIPAGSVHLEGDLEIPEAASGLVLFAHGSGSSRHSPRNQLVARALRAAGVGTLLMDLLTIEEERDDFDTRQFRFDIGLLAERLENAWQWVSGMPETGALPTGFFGASTGAAAALVAAARIGPAVKAVVSRGGRPDLADRSLADVTAPTLLIVGGRDETVRKLNEIALAELRATKELAVVPGATHLFEEPGALQQVAQLAARWFARYLTT
jgi:putative phosphoribosyl transferase